MIRRLLIDGDAILYRVAASLQQEAWWDDHTRTVTMDVARAVRDCDAEIAKLKDRAKADVVFVFIGPSDKSQNFRKKLWPAYKAHRRSADVPVGLGELRKRMMTESAFLVQTAQPDYEADDVIAQYATDCGTCGHENIIWSPDKDLDQIEGWRMNDDGMYRISDVMADRYHIFQTLTGDASDGYPGCPSVGPVKADKILGCLWQPESVWALVVEAYEKQGLTEQDALVQARVARILRAGERPGEWLPAGGLIRS